MTAKQVEDKLTELVHHEPFIPFVVELVDGQSLIIPHAPAFDDTGAVLIGLEDRFVEFEFKNVRAIRQLNAEAVA
jgi:hypothetical protein